MLLLAIMFIFIPVCFPIVNWEQLKSCFKNNRLKGYKWVVHLEKIKRAL